ncbi:hypothetical protein [Planktosalinus lacus]|uniref:Adhesin domain-containing protein n=1 Tax=Planktosalinus lacus TaxID=1526573 RepID=A0A8J2VA03_9FLAO|nr:hypothetical protein [Planktosalinus lacus]GGD93237.1 hypothetical protein GCM10011312_16220 [Planktosalinus lacus]
MKPLYKVIILLFLLPAVVIANDSNLNGKHTKEKKIKKQFEVSEKALLKINNRYGNVDITTWNQNSISIEVTIITNGNNEEEVQKRLDEITVEFNASKSQVSAETLIAKKKSNWSFWGSNTGKVNMKINYLVKMPISNSLDIKNDYGAISLNEIDGNVNISCNYGTFILGDLNGSENFLQFDYTTKASINYINQATINADYSEYEIKKANNISYNGDYTRVLIEEVKEKIDFGTSYGKVQINAANSVKGESRYVTSTFGKISNSLELDSKYGRISVDELKKGFKNVFINAKYTSIEIGYNADANFDLETNLSYANLSGQNNFEFTVQNIQNTKKDFKGYYGSSNSGNSIQIISGYGGVTLKKNN